MQVAAGRKSRHRGGERELVARAAGARKLGRPFDAQLDVALLEAAERVMAADGFASLNVDRLVTEVGTTRAAFYRRYRNIGYIVFDVITKKFGQRQAPDTGSLEGDMLRLARDEVAMFADPVFRHSIPGLLESMRTDAELRARYANSLILPRRSTVRAVIERAAERGDIPTPTTETVEWVCDLIVGPVLTHSVLPLGAGVDDRLARRIAEATCGQLGTAR